VARTDLRDFYTGEAASYETVRYGSKYGRLFRTIHRNAIVRILSSRQGWKNALDVASGTGQLLPPLLAVTDLVVASDLTPAMLKVSRSNNVLQSKLAFCVADATRLPYNSASFEIVASARFLHLFEPDRQTALIGEMARVLASDGLLIVDFYSLTSRRIFGPLIWAYRTLLRKRPENDHRVSGVMARRMVEAAGLKVVEVRGVGNFLLAPLSWLPQKWLLAVAFALSGRFAALSEQFIVVASKP
jgi:ubiquinone/menaquinone biosynthesis C-methylase UbiE